MCIQSLSTESLVRFFKNFQVFLTQSVAVGLVMQRWHMHDTGIGSLEEAVKVVIRNVLLREFLYSNTVYWLLLIWINGRTLQTTILLLLLISVNYFLICVVQCLAVEYVSILGITTVFSEDGIIALQRHTNFIRVIDCAWTSLVGSWLLSHHNSRTESLVLQFIRWLAGQLILHLYWLVFATCAFPEDIAALRCHFSSGGQLKLAALTYQNWAELIVLATRIVVFDHVILNSLES